MKHWYSRVTTAQAGVGDPSAQDIYTGGYMNTTSAVDAIRFQFAAGNFDGIIQLWGL